MSGRLLLYDAHSCAFRNVRLRARRPDCAVCADRPAITRLEAVPGAAGPQSCPAAPAPLPAGHAASVEELAAARRGDSNGSNGSNGSNDSAVVIDVRDELQYAPPLPARPSFPLAFPQPTAPTLAPRESTSQPTDSAFRALQILHVPPRRGALLPARVAAQPRGRAGRRLQRQGPGVCRVPPRDLLPDRGFRRPPQRPGMRRRPAAAHSDSGAPGADPPGPSFADCNAAGDGGCGELRGGRRAGRAARAGCPGWPGGVGGACRPALPTLLRSGQGRCPARVRRGAEAEGGRGCAQLRPGKRPAL